MSVNGTICAKDLNSYRCAGLGLLLPVVSELTWSDGLRATLYGILLIWSLIPLMLLVDILSCAIEKIAAKTKTILVADPDSPCSFEEMEVKLWNDTVVSVTLLAFGPKAPEILLNMVDTLQNGFRAEELGHMTVLGSATFNMLFVSAICIAAVPSPEVRRVKHMRIFAVILVFGVFPYIWLLIVLMVLSPNYVEIWEAVCTFVWFPIFVLLAYLADRSVKGGSKKPAKETKYVSIQLGFHERRYRSRRRKKKSHEGHVDRNTVHEAFQDLCHQSAELGEEEAAKIVARQYIEKKSHHQLWYRINATRHITSGPKLLPTLNDKLTQVYRDAKKANVERLHPLVGLMPASQSDTAVVEFTCKTCSVFEGDGHVNIGIQRHGRMDNEVHVRVQTVDGTAAANEDFKPLDEIVVFKPREAYKTFDIEIIDDFQWEPDEMFFVKLSVDPGKQVRVGRQSVLEVTIIDDDVPGSFQFARPSYVVKESTGAAKIPIQRVDGADGKVSVAWKTKDISAKSGEHYHHSDENLAFEHGETEKCIEIPIYNQLSSRRGECFEVVIHEAYGGASLGRVARTVITIVNDDEYNAMLTRLVDMANMNIDALHLDSPTWTEQFYRAMNIRGGDVDDGKWSDYLFHLFSFGWKVIFAFIPPSSLWGGWPTFIISLWLIGGLIAVVTDLARIFGCLVGLKDSVTAITILAVGVGIPDVVASKNAAVKEKFADSTMGSLIVTNSINVFLGLGVPWTVASIYWTMKGQRFLVPSAKLGFSITYYLGSSLLCILLLLIRRYVKFFGQAELGGPRIRKIICVIFLIALWVIYTLLTILQAYDVILPRF